ncbi:NAD(P)-dependent dehydrogenase (short-subunit alcohol dehydrogenase family) [Arthrobacter sp. UYP6]|uniref:SDR family NAD(P)-dependent oxidoreductase n=1 Tax=Arthrobacter sp. UYP6 TaxID=1756378 RepID=UPI003396CE1B
MVTTEYLDLMVQAANRLMGDSLRPATAHLVPSAVPPAPNDWVEPCVEGRFDGKTVVVSGAASGIGRATALRVAREGGHVLAIDLSTLRMEALLESNPDLDITGVVADISNQSDVNKIAVQALGRVDCLAVVAGIAENMVALHEVEDELWESVLRINVGGPFRLSRALIPLMLARGTGSIVNVSSQAGLRGSIAGAAYTTSKHAVIGLSDDAANVTGAILPADDGWGVA